MRHRSTHKSASLNRIIAFVLVAYVFMALGMPFTYAAQSLDIQSSQSCDVSSMHGTNDVIPHCDDHSGKNDDRHKNCAQNGLQCVVACSVSCATDIQKLSTSFTSPDSDTWNLSYHNSDSIIVLSSLDRPPQL